MSYCMFNSRSNKPFSILWSASSALSPLLCDIKRYYIFSYFSNIICNTLFLIPLANNLCLLFLLNSVRLSSIFVSIRLPLSRSEHISYILFKPLETDSLAIHIIPFLYASIFRSFFEFHFSLWPNFVLNNTKKQFFLHSLLSLPLTYLPLTSLIFEALACTSTSAGSLHTLHCMPAVYQTFTNTSP